MSAETKAKNAIKCDISFTLKDSDGNKVAGGEAKATVSDDSVSIVPASGESLLFSPREIVDFKEGDYKIRLTLTSGEKLALFHIGHYYEDFLRILSSTRNQVVSDDMLMKEAVVFDAASADFRYSEADGTAILKGECRPKLFETGIVIMPSMGEPVRIPYSDIMEIQEEEYSVFLTLESGRTLALLRMGRESGPFKKALNGAMNELSLKAMSALKEILPMTDSLTIRKAARLMREGRAAMKKDLDAISPGIWESLEYKLKSAGIGEEYEYLKSISQKDSMCIGIKRGLMGDFTGEYLWLLAPVYSTDHKKPGNAIIMESVMVQVNEDEAESPEEFEEEEIEPTEEEEVESAEGESDQSSQGKATYIFRMAGRKEYKEYNDLNELHREAARFTGMLNRSLIAVNFRREPIYLSDDKLQGPKYNKYQHSIQRLPELRTLRDHFVGRVMHKSRDQWKADLADALKFNVSAADDKARWSKSKVKKQSE